MPVGGGARFVAQPAKRLKAESVLSHLAEAVELTRRFLDQQSARAAQARHGVSSQGGPDPSGLFSAQGVAELEFESKEKAKAIWAALTGVKVGQPTQWPLYEDHEQ